MAASVLLIDDDEPFAESLAASFHARGIALDVANTWDEGLALFRIGLHELVVADYNLRGSKLGLKLLLEVKRLRPSARLILISGAVTPSASDMIEASALVDRFIRKTGDLAPDLLDEARSAEVRATEATDWKAVGAAHVTKDGIDEGALEAVDVALRTQIDA